MKVVMMSAINAQSSEKFDGETLAIKATWDTLIKKFNKERKQHGITSHDSLYAMLDAIKERHPLIAEHLESGAGIKLQREDSDIAIDIIAQHTKMNVPILTIQDSFVVPRSFEPFTRDIMNQAFGKLVSKYLGESYNSTIETIHFAKGVLEGKDTSNNMNVSGLIKKAFKEHELVDAYNRIDARVTSKQMNRMFRWKNNRYQFDKVSNTL